MSARARSESEILGEAAEHLELALRHSHGDLHDQLVVDAVCLRLSVGIEALSRLDEARRQQVFGDLWPLMWATRNRIAHGYLTLDSRVMEATIRTDLPHLVALVDEARSG